MSVTINIGCREYGYHALNSNYTKDILLDYIENVSGKYEGQFVEENINLAKRIINGLKIDDKKAMKLAQGSTIVMGALLLMLEPTSAFAEVIDTKPIDKFVNEVYWTMVKVLGYLALPVYAWIAFTLIGAGTSPEKRSVAKQIFIYATLALGLVIGAPWLKNSIVALWNYAFA